MPKTIGIRVPSLLAFLSTMSIHTLILEVGIAEVICTTITGIDFSTKLLGGVLGFLRFTDARRVKLSNLRTEWSLVMLIAMIGVDLSTAIFLLGFA